MKNKYSKVGGKCMQGAVAVELALLLIPLIVMAFGVAEFGRAMYEYNTLTKSVRDAVRHVSQSSSAVDEAKCLAVHGTTDCTGPEILPSTGLGSGLSEDMVKICPGDFPCPSSSINLVEVRITNYTFGFVFNPLVFFGNTSTDIGFGDIHATMRQQ